MIQPNYTFFHLADKYQPCGYPSARQKFSRRPENVEMKGVDYENQKMNKKIYCTVQHPRRCDPDFSRWRRECDS